MEARLKQAGILLLGTNRADGWPRISPCEGFVFDGDLLFGMIWRSKKALDLGRDPRLTVVTPRLDSEGIDGDLKLYGTAAGVEDPSRRSAYAEALEAATGWKPREPYHLFAFDVQRAGFISFGAERRMVRWSPETGVEELAHPTPEGP